MLYIYNGLQITPKRRKGQIQPGHRVATLSSAELSTEYFRSIRLWHYAFLYKHQFHNRLLTFIISQSYQFIQIYQDVQQGRINASLYRSWMYNSLPFNHDKWQLRRKTMLNSPKCYRWQINPFFAPRKAIFILARVLEISNPLPTYHKKTGIVDHLSLAAPTLMDKVIFQWAYTGCP